MYFSNIVYINLTAWIRQIPVTRLLAQQSLLSPEIIVSHMNHWFFVTPWTATCQAPLSSVISGNLIKFMSIESVILSSHLILCHPLSFCLQSFPALGSFPMYQVFTPGGQLELQLLPMKTQGWFPLGLTGLITLQCKGLSRVFSSNTIQKHQFFDALPSLWFNSHIHTWPLEKPQLWLHGRWLAKWCLCF